MTAKIKTMSTTYLVDNSGDSAARYAITGECTYDSNNRLSALAGGIVTEPPSAMPVARFDGFGSALSVYFNTDSDRGDILAAICSFTTAIQTA